MREGGQRLCAGLVGSGVFKRERESGGTDEAVARERAG